MSARARNRAGNALFLVVVLVFVLVLDLILILVLVDVVLDLLFASSGVEPEVVATADTLELLDGLRIPVATVPALIALKLLARDDVRRPQDRVDLVALMAVASEEDHAEVRRLTALITQRGFARTRDLHAAFEALVLELHNR